MTPRTLVTAAFVMTVLVLGLSARASIHAGSPSRDPLRGRGHSNRIVVENVHQGTTGWVTPEFRQSRSPRDRRSSPRLRAAAVWNDSTIRGYAGATSYNRDEPIDLHISTSAPSYDVEVHRMGWYGATGARLFLTVTGLPGLDQPVPAPDPITGLIEPSWQTTHTLQPGADWISGVYLAKLTASGGATDYVIFVLRDDGAPADLLFQVAVTTYQAYNNWGGKSLYGFNSTGDERANVVSFDRPYERWDGAGGFFDGDYNMIRWLEREGYDVTYVTSLDVQQSPSIFNNRPVFVSNFHDEYWSTPMRDNLVAAQAAGTDLAFFDSNNLYWQVRFEPSSSGVADRRMVGYKDAALDPLSEVQPALTTVRFRDPRVNAPENQILGVQHTGNFEWAVTVPWIVRNPDHWIYQGTGLSDGDAIAGLVGYEMDSLVDNGLAPPGLTVLAESPFVDIDGVPGTHNAVIFERSNGAIVFSAGTNYWSWKLDDNDAQAAGVDTRVQQMTRNVLDTMIGAAAVPPASLTVTALVVNDDGGAATPGDLTLRIDGAVVPASVAQTLSPGGHTVSIDPLPGYTFAIGGACSPGGSVTLAAGGTLTCTLLADDDAPAPPVSSGLTIYDDALDPGWANWSWNTTVNFAASSPVFRGSAALSAEVTTIWGGLYLHANAPVDLSGFTELRFLARATAPGQIYWVYLTDTANQRLGNALQLSALAGDPTPDGWTEYRIPLDASGLNVGAGPINGFIFQDYSGSPHPPVYLDELGFVAAAAPPPPDTTTLTLALTIRNDDAGTATPADFALRIDGAVVPASVAQTLSPGSHTVSIDPLPGYTFAVGGACSPGGSVTLAAGDTRVETKQSPHEGTLHLRLCRDTGLATRSIDLSGYEDASLRACVRVDGFAGADQAHVLSSTDGGVTWSTLHVFAHGDDDNTYRCFEWAIPSGQVVTIAFDAEMSDKKDQIWLDAIEVVARPIGGGLAAPLRPLSSAPRNATLARLTKRPLPPPATR